MFRSQGKTSTIYKVKVHTPISILQGCLLLVFAVTPWRIYMNEADSQPSSLTFIQKIHPTAAAAAPNSTCLPPMHHLRQELCSVRPCNGLLFR